MRQRGLIIAGPTNDVQQGTLQYDTRKTHLITSLTASPKHLDILDNFIPGTALALTGILNDDKKEVLFSIPHNLGFTPEILGYFFVKSISGDPSQGGGYGQQNYVFAGGAFQDYVYIYANDTDFQIIHEVIDFGSSTTWTSPAPTYVMRVKYFIFANPTDRILT